MVHLMTYLAPTRIHLDVPGETKEALLKAASDHLSVMVKELSSAQIHSLLTSREHLASTGVGDGIAIPHASAPELQVPCLSLFRPQKPVPFDAVDDRPVNLMMVVLAPQNAQALHLRLLARIARLVRSAAVREKLLAAQSPEEVYAYIKSLEGS